MTPNLSLFSSGGRNNESAMEAARRRHFEPTLVLGMVEKDESVAWMLHVPDSPKIKKWK